MVGKERNYVLFASLTVASLVAGYFLYRKMTTKKRKGKNKFIKQIYRIIDTNK